MGSGWILSSFYQKNKYDKPWHVWVPCFQTNPNIMPVFLHPSIHPLSLEGVSCKVWWTWKICWCTYPLVNIQKTMKITILYNGKTMKNSHFNVFWWGKTMDNHHLDWENSLSLAMASSSQTVRVMTRGDLLPIDFTQVFHIFHRCPQHRFSVAFPSIFQYVHWLHP